jgi:tryptophanyl-tRNA synthetase
MANLHACRDNFKKELKSFLKDLIKVFPEDRDIKMISSSLNIALMDDEDKIITKVYNTLHPFETHINTRDERFFSEAQNIDTDVPLFAKLDLYWSNLNDDNRTIVWDYIHVLYALSKAVFVQIK